MLQTMLKLNTRLLALLTAVLLMVCTVPVAYAAGDACGDNLTWSLENGTLTITGTGAMYDYGPSNRAPWYECRAEILWLSLPEGLTYVGDKAFFDCMNLLSIKLPSTVTAVGEAAFCQCSSVTMLSLNEGLTTIGRSAFEQCEGLYDLRLPESVTTLGNHAFYRCSGLRYVQVPSGVTNMGIGVFAYCESLLRADIYAQLDTLPGWTFYGCEQINQISLPGTMKHSAENAFERCENLLVVDYEGGTNEEAKVLRADIMQDLPKFKTSGHVNVSGIPVAGAAQSVTSKETETSAVLTTTTVTATPNATVTTSKERIWSETGLKTEPQAQVGASVKNEDGWDEVVAEIIRLMNEMEAQKKKNETVSVSVNASVTGDNVSIPREVVYSLAGSKVDITIENESGGKFVLDCESISANAVTEEKAVATGFTYTISATEPPVEALDGAATTYQLRFHGQEKINAEVLVRLPGGHAYQKANLYQQGKNGIELLQKVIVDETGSAHFFLGSVDDETEYLIAINVPQKETESQPDAAPEDAGNTGSSGQTGTQATVANDVVVPKSLYASYGITEITEPVQYVITGRKSSWGMNIGQVTWILAGVMFAVVTVVGVTMFLLNRHKLKMGYVPDLGDEDEK